MTVVVLPPASVVTVAISEVASLSSEVTALKTELTGRIVATTVSVVVEIPELALTTLLELETVTVVKAVVVVALLLV